MSLDYNLTKIANRDTLCWETRTGTPEEMAALVARVTFMGPDWAWTDDSKTSVTRRSVTTHVLIFASMHVGFGSITEKNWEAYFERLSTVEQVLGPFRTSEEGPVFFTPDDVKAHIGLSTNVGAESPAKFNAKVARWRRENAAQTSREKA
jgi:hypothetical protein